MPPRETTICDSEMDGSINGGVQVKVLKRGNGNSPRMHSHRIAGKGNAVPVSAGEIPWRTSRRLQEATLRLIKERPDGGQPHNHVSVKDEDYSRITESLPAAHSPPKRLWESEPRGERQEDHAGGVPVEDSGNQCVAEAEQMSPAVETAAVSLKFRRKVKRRRKVPLNDSLPIFTQEDNKSRPSSSSDASDEVADKTHISTPAVECKGASGKKVQLTVAGSGIPTNNVKLPQSCFDLLCSHVGYRGWRCYRSCIVGQPFCIHHRRESTTVTRICVYT